MSAGELNFNSMIELSRLMVAIKYQQMEISQEEVWALAEAAGCG